MSEPAKNVSSVEGIMNAVHRRLGAMFPGYFQADEKHDHYRDFGYPEIVVFDQLWQMFRRNALARAAVDKTTRKVWQDNPFILEAEEVHDETRLERDLREALDRLRFWQHVAEADRRSLVGRYSGLIFRLADNKRFQDPVDTVPGGLDGLVEIIPAWEGQLEVSTWDTDEASPTYGQPTMFQFNEARFSKDQTKTRSFMVHPDRVVIWSRDGSIHGESLLEAGFNDLLVMEKVAGAGGEGFWKNARSSPVLEIDKEARLETLAQMLGVTNPAEIADKLSEVVDDYQKGFDKALMLQGIQAKGLSITLPSPEHFFNIALQSFAASVSMPLKILIGNQTGERASTEDANDWAQTCQARRSQIARPNIREVITRLQRFRVINERLSVIDWSDLTEMSMDQKIDRAVKMADVNQKSGFDAVFTGDEIREVIDLEPLEPMDEDEEREALDEAVAAAGGE